VGTVVQVVTVFSEIILMPKEDQMGEMVEKEVQLFFEVMPNYGHYYT
jgi:hypothetical protein